MADAKASGASAANGSAQHRSHNDGSSGRAFTTEQKAAVIRVRKCGTTAFYDILGLEEVKTTIDDSGIKKAYRKLSLLTHPDKNGYTGADEAFKMVSRAFQILSDPDKKKRFDQFGGDPDNRFASSGAGQSSPFSGFATRQGARGGGSMFEEEISPEELFRQFFGGGMGGGGFGGGPFGMDASSSTTSTSGSTRTQNQQTQRRAQTQSQSVTESSFSFNFSWNFGWSWSGGWSSNSSNTHAQRVQNENTG